MSPKGKGYAGYLWAAIAGLLAFGVGYVQHRWFYPLEFHGDSAAMHILAKAILAQGSLLPADFYYGNQLIFLRSSPFIALASVFGLAGSSAFIVGSALSIAFWSVVLYVLLAAFLRSHWKAALISTLLLLPFGIWDSDFVLGQQSHLSNAVLSLGLVVYASLHVAKRDRTFLVAAAVCLFVMSSESPIRGLLVLGPVLVSILFAAGLKRAIAAAVPLGMSFVLAYALNKWLIHLRPIALNYLQTLSFKPTDEILNNLARTSKEALGSVSSLNTVAGETISLAGFVILGAGLLLTVFYLGFFLSGTIGAVRMAAAGLGKHLPADGGADKDGDTVRLVRLTSVFGLILGSLAVAALNPDSSRHYLWVIFVAKLFFLTWTFDFLANRFGRNKSVLAIIVLALVLSSWFAYLVKFHWHTSRVIKEKTAAEAVASIEDISRKTGIRHIYGEDFWRMMPLNTFVPGMNAQTLLLDGAEIRPYNWLTMPSWSCVKGNVLYYLKDGTVDGEIRKRLLETGGVLLKDGTGYAIWQGPRVWKSSDMPACAEEAIDRRGASFAALPSTVGVQDGDARKTNGSAGFLVFGPYSSLRAGTYTLSVYGTSERVEGAYVDVISHGVKSVHGRFQLGQSVRGPLLFQSVVDVPSNVPDLEVRVWVGQQDSLVLHGYTLTPASGK